jgi:hypothetical protein
MIHSFPFRHADDDRSFSSAFPTDIPAHFHPNFRLQFALPLLAVASGETSLQNAVSGRGTVQIAFVGAPENTISLGI